MVDIWGYNSFKFLQILEILDCFFRLCLHSHLKSTAGLCEGSEFREVYQVLGHCDIQGQPHLSIYFNGILTRL